MSTSPLAEKMQTNVPKTNASDHVADRGEHAGGVEWAELIRIAFVVLAAAAVWFRLWEPFPRISVIGIAATLTALWIVLRASTVLLRDALFARLVATVALIIAALDIFGLLEQTAILLDSIAWTIGATRLAPPLASKTPGWE